VDYWQRDASSNAKSTQQTHLSNLRTAAHRLDHYDATLADADVNTLNDLLTDYDSGTHPDVADNGIVPDPHQSSLRNFYGHHGLVDDPSDIDCDSDYDGRELEALDLWIQDDVNAWLDATRNGNARGFRDRAMFALALATGQRIDAIRSLRIKHITRLCTFI